MEILTLEELQVWDDIVSLCEDKEVLNINVGSRKRRTVIIKKAQCVLSPPLIKLPANPWQNNQGVNSDRRLVINLYRDAVKRTLEEAGFKVEDLLEKKRDKNDCQG